MSIFKGIVKEYPQIAFDYFYIQRKFYFLTHFHDDHVRGLKELLPTSETKIYCSEVTKELLACDTRYKHIVQHLLHLPINQKVELSVENFEDPTKDSQITVTLSQTGHCLGSVMFLIEGAGGTVLYTGDFRMPLGSAPHIKALHDGLQAKTVDAVYVDTTFLLEPPQWAWSQLTSSCGPTVRHLPPKLMESLQSSFGLHFPTRKECMDSMSQLCTDWLKHSPNHVVKLVFSHKHSYEAVLAELRTSCCFKIHVTRPMWELYSQVTVLHNLVEHVVTRYPHDTRIHACGGNNRNAAAVSNGDNEDRELPCGYRGELQDQRIHVLTLHLSVLHFLLNEVEESTQDDECSPFGDTGSLMRQGMVRIAPHYVRLCFCAHPSTLELIDFINYLKPVKAVACVVPPGQTLQQVQQRLDRVVEAVRGSSSLMTRSVTAGPVARGRISDVETALPASLLACSRKRRYSDPCVTNSQEERTEGASEEKAAKCTELCFSLDSPASHVSMVPDVDVKSALSPIPEDGDLQQDNIKSSSSVVISLSSASSDSSQETIIPSSPSDGNSVQVVAEVIEINSEDSPEDGNELDVSSDSLNSSGHLSQEYWPEGEEEFSHHSASILRSTHTKTDKPRHRLRYSNLFRNMEEPVIDLTGDDDDEEENENDGDEIC